MNYFADRVEMFNIGCEKHGKLRMYFGLFLIPLFLLLFILKEPLIFIETKLSELNNWIEFIF